MRGSASSKSRRIRLMRARAAREAENIAGGGRHRVDMSEREVIEASRLQAPLSRVTEALNAQLQTPEAWAEVWSDVTTERGR